MNIVVAIKHIPSTADDLPVKGNNIDFDSVDFVLNEFDEQAIEQAVLVKEAVGGSVTVIGVDPIGELDPVLHLAQAKGADKAAKIAAADPGVNSHQQAKWLAEAIKNLSPNLIFTGVQASNDIDGQIGPMIAAILGFPYIGGVSSAEVYGDQVIVTKEFAGGIVGKYAMDLPAVVGVQSSAKPPRYAPISKVRQVALSTKNETITPSGELDSGLIFKKIAPPVNNGHAEMLTGSSKEVAAKIIDLLKSKGLA